MIDKWLKTQGLHQVARFPKLFVRRNQAEIPTLLIAKVVDDMLLAGEASEMISFVEKLAKRFEVGRHVEDPSFVFNRLAITRSPESHISFDMDE